MSDETIPPARRRELSAWLDDLMSELRALIERNAPPRGSRGRRS